MKFAEIYDKLIILEEEIENCYIKLVESELDNNDVDYEYYFQILSDDVNAELYYYKIICNLDYADILNKKIKEELKDTNEFIISLGRHSKAMYYRLKYFIEAASFDDNLDYITTLRSDRTKIMLAMLNKMLENEFFSPIFEELVWFKYNLLYMHPYPESDFLFSKEINTSLDTDCYRTQDFPSSTYLDKAELVLPSIDALDYIIASADSGFTSDDNIFANITLRLLTVISSMTLCTEENIRSVLFTINDILENPEYSFDLKNLLQEMINILQSIKSNISYKR